MCKNRCERSKQIGNERGSILLTSYMLITILVILGAAFAVLMTAESRAAERGRRTAQAFAIAEAGIERALYMLKLDFTGDPTPSWSDGAISTLTIGPNTASYYDMYAAVALNNGTYTVQVMNVVGATDAVWVKSTGTAGGSTQTIQAYAEMYNVSPWDNAIFAGAGASGAMVNGNVNIRGSVHILGEGLASTDYAIDLGGTAELVGNNYNGLAASLEAKVPALSTTVVAGETVETLNAELRVKHGRIGLSGSSTVGEVNVAGNAEKELIDGAYVTDGYGGTAGTGSVYSDNGWSNGYDLGDAVSFPSLSDPYPGYASYQAYLRANALVITNAAQLAQLANITPTSSFNYSNANGAISMDGSGNMAVSGVVYIDGGSFNTSKAGSNKTITYTGTGSVLATGNMQINTNLVTSGNNSFPTNIIGLMTPGSIGFNEANIDVMGMIYGETSVVVQKQTDIMGTIVSNYFNMGTNVPAIYQVPDAASHLPPGLIGQSSSWFIRTIDWQKI